MQWLSIVHTKSPKKKFETEIRPRFDRENLWLGLKGIPGSGEKWRRSRDRKSCLINFILIGHSLHIKLLQCLSMLSFASGLNIARVFLLACIINQKILALKPVLQAKWSRKERKKFQFRFCRELELDKKKEKANLNLALLKQKHSFVWERRKSERKWRMQFNWKFL